MSDSGQIKLMKKSPHIVLTRKWAQEGIEITHIKEQGKIWISGWYDNTKRIQGREMSVQEFMIMLELPTDLTVYRPSDIP